MFTVKVNPDITTSDTWAEIHCYEHDNYRNELVAANITITQSTTEIDTLTFDLYPNSVGYGVIEWNVFKSWVEVYELGSSSGEGDLGNVAFQGRVIGITQEMDNDGVMFKHVVCESVEAFLLDTAYDNSLYLRLSYEESAGSGTNFVRVTDEVGSAYYINPIRYFKWLLENHNGQCTADTWQMRQIYPGVVDLPDDLYSYTVEPTTEGVTRDGIVEIAEALGCEFKVYPMQVDEYLSRFGQPDPYIISGDTWGDGVTEFVTVIDIAPRVSQGTAGTVALGYNMMDCLRETDYTDLVNRVELKGPLVSLITTPPGGMEGKQKVQVDANAIFEGALANETDPLASINDLAPWVANNFSNVNGLPLSLVSEVVGDRTHWYITDEDSVSRYGRITRNLDASCDGLTCESDQEDGRNVTVDITATDLKNGFLATAARYVRDHSQPIVSVEANAVDLGNLGVDIAGLQTYDWWRISNHILGIDEELEVKARTMYVNEPHRSTVEFGARKASQNQVVASTRRTTKKTAEGVKSLEKEKLSKREPATKSRVGGVKVGDGLAITNDGVLSATGGGSSLVYDEVYIYPWSYGNNAVSAYNGWDISRTANNDGTSRLITFDIPLYAIARAFGVEVTPYAYDRTDAGDTTQWKLRNTPFVITDVQVPIRAARLAKNASTGKWELLTDVTDTFWETFYWTISPTGAGGDRPCLSVTGRIHNQNAIVSASSPTGATMLAAAVHISLLREGNDPTITRIRTMYNPVAGGHPIGTNYIYPISPSPIQTFKQICQKYGVNIA